MLAAFALTFVALSIGSYTRTSATADEPGHLTSAYAALAHGDYRVDVEHPPLLRKWQALPLVAMGDLSIDLAAIDSVRPFTWATGRLYRYAQRFTYRDNDADRMLYAARLMNVLLGVGLGVLLFAWAYEWSGMRAGAIALIALTLEPNLFANASLVTTDFGVAVMMFGAVYFLWRVHREATRTNIAGLALFCAAAITSKFSAVLLAPILAALLGFAVRSGRLSARRAIALAIGLIAVSWIAVWAVYGFRHAPSDSAEWAHGFHTSTAVQERVPGLARVVAAVDRWRLFPNAFIQGFLIGQAKAQVHPAYLAGEVSDTGWWYYFPAAFLIKTPIALLILAVLGAWLSLRRRDRTSVFLFVPIALYMAVVMTSKLNIGIRHLLPIYPFVILLAVSAASWLLARGRRSRAALAGLGTLWLFEVGRVYPSPLAFFNLLVGGPDRGGEYLADSNFDWGQDLKGLKRWMDRHDVATINLAYFGAADPAYYGMSVRRLPTVPVASDDFDPPLIPGYVAIGATVASGLGGGPPIRDFYAPLWRRRPVATIGHTIRVYYVERPWWR